MRILTRIRQFFSRKNNKPWYIVIERSNIPEYNDIQWEQIVVGPFHDELKCIDHMDFSMDIEDWCYGEAKAKQYNVDHVYMTQTPDIPSYGINEPILDEAS